MSGLFTNRKYLVKVYSLNRKELECPLCDLMRKMASHLLRTDFPTFLLTDFFRQISMC